MLGENEMKVKELIQKLQKLDAEIDIVLYTEDEIFSAKNHSFRLLEIASIEVSDAEKVRTENGLPYLKFGQSSSSRKHAVLVVTGDF
jgi:hypothetical protein